MHRTMIILSASSLRTAKSLTCNWWAASRIQSKNQDPVVYLYVGEKVSAQLPEVRYTRN